MTDTFKIARIAPQPDGKTLVYSTAYEAIERFNNARFAMERAQEESSKASLALFAANEERKAALDSLEIELSNLYGDNMPDAMEIPGGVLVFHPEDGPVFYTTRTWVDTYRVDHVVAEAA